MVIRFVLVIIVLLVLTIPRRYIQTKCIKVSDFNLTAPNGISNPEVCYSLAKQNGHKYFTISASADSSHCVTLADDDKRDICVNSCGITGNSYTHLYKLEKWEDLLNPIKFIRDRSACGYSGLMNISTFFIRTPYVLRSL